MPTLDSDQACRDDARNKSSKLGGSQGPWTTGVRSERSTIGGGCLRDHVVPELEAIDRMYLNVYVPNLQTVRPVVGCLRVHRGHGAGTRYLFPSSIACFPE